MNELKKVSDRCLAHFPRSFKYVSVYIHLFPILRTAENWLTV